VNEKVLVTYVSRAGATGEAAKAVGQVLCDTGTSVEVRTAGEVADFGAYSAVIGTPAGPSGPLKSRKGDMQLTVVHWVR